MSNHKLILVLVGPSGSGKTTIGNELAKHGIPKLITTTTRPPRENEVNGKDYYFRTREEMTEEPFVEQTVYNGYLYGLTVNEVEKSLKQHDIVHVSMDRNGVEAMLRTFPEETRIIYFKISEEEMRNRMEKRGDSEEKIKERLQFGRESGEYIAPPQTHLIVKNEVIDQTVQEILNAFQIKNNRV